MKSGKWILLSVLTCLLCANQAFSQAPQIACGVAAYEHNTSTLAIFAHETEVLDYVVDVTNGPFPIINGVVTLTLPDETVVTLDDDLSLPAFGTASYPVTFPPVPANQEYTIDKGDIGNNTAPAGFVQALSRCEADAIISVGPPQVTVVVTGDGQWPTKVITPCIDVNKTVEPTVSIVGGDVVYTITICNCGDTDLTLTAVDDNVVGVIADWLAYVPADGLVLNPQECTTFEVPYTIQQDDPDPLCDTVCATGVDPIGGPAGTVQDCDPACVDLVEPNIEIVKSCDEFSKAGDVITYEVTITNTGQTDLEILSVEDDVADANQVCVGQILVPSASCGFSYPYTVQPADPDPLINTVSVVAKVVGVDVNVSDSTICETDILHPDFDVNKECLTEPVEGDTAQFRITITNTGDVNLIITTDEPELPGPNDLLVGQTIVFDVNRVVVPGSPEVENTVEVTATLPREYRLSNEITKSASASCTVPGAEGCTPGFWKTHTDCWDCYSPTQRVDSVFTIPSPSVLTPLADDTLLAALKYKGGRNTRGAAQILLRAAVSALLNSCDTDIEYPLTQGAVIDAVNDALATMDRGEILSLATTLDAFNNLGCPIGSDCNPIPPILP